MTAEVVWNIWLCRVWNFASAPSLTGAVSAGWPSDSTLGKRRVKVDWFDAVHCRGAGRDLQRVRRNNPPREYGLWKWRMRVHGANCNAQSAQPFGPFYFFLSLPHTVLGTGQCVLESSQKSQGEWGHIFVCAWATGNSGFLSVAQLLHLPRFASRCYAVGL